MVGPVKPLAGVAVAEARGPSPGTGEGLRSQAQGEGAAAADTHCAPNPEHNPLSLNSADSVRDLGHHATIGFSGGWAATSAASAARLRRRP